MLRKTLIAVAAAVAVVFFVAASSSSKGASMNHATYTKPSDAELKKKLTPMQYEVTQHAATEPPRRNEFWDNHTNGIYVDIVSGKPLFSSLDKFDSGCGWPSFSKPIEQIEITQKDDYSYLGM